MFNWFVFYAAFSFSNQPPYPVWQSVWLDCFHHEYAGAPTCKFYYQSMINIQNLNFIHKIWTYAVRCCATLFMMTAVMLVFGVLGEVSSSNTEKFSENACILFLPEHESQPSYLAFTILSISYIQVMLFHVTFLSKIKWSNKLWTGENLIKWSLRAIYFW